MLTWTGSKTSASCSSLHLGKNDAAAYWSSGGVCLCSDAAGMWCQRFRASITETAWGRACRCYLCTAGSASPAVIRWWLLKWTNWTTGQELNSGKCSLSPGGYFPLVLNWGKESAWGRGWGDHSWIIRSATSEWPLLLCWWAGSALCAEHVLLFDASLLTLFCTFCHSGEAASESLRSVVEMECILWDSCLQTDF